MRTSLEPRGVVVTMDVVRHIEERMDEEDAARDAAQGIEPEGSWWLHHTFCLTRKKGGREEFDTGTFCFPLEFAHGCPDPQKDIGAERHCDIIRAMESYRLGRIREGWTILRIETSLVKGEDRVIPVEDLDRLTLQPEWWDHDPEPVDR